MLGVADSERLLPLLAELLPGLGELAHCKLGHGEALQGRSVRGKPEEGGKAHIVCGKACRIETAGTYILKADKLAESVFLPPKIGGKSA